VARSRWRRYVWHRAGIVARAAGSVSAGRRAEPDVLVVGAQRAGTTSLFKALVQHPSFVPPRFRKGVHYFDMEYDKGRGWYLGHFPTRRTLRRVATATGGAVTGEASPYYMWHPTAPTRIARTLPNVKIIVLLRDPVERAYSGHAHEIARGFETEDFARAIELEPQRLAGERERMIADPTYHSQAVRHQAHVMRGEYIDQIEHLETLFGRERLLVLDSDDYFTDPRAVFTEVCAFLGIPDGPDVVHEQHNARPRTALDPRLEARLREHYEPYDERLAKWLGTVPSWRR
jgi:hypothetical protein